MTPPLSFTNPDQASVAPQQLSYFYSNKLESGTTPGQDREVESGTTPEHDQEGGDNNDYTESENYEEEVKLDAEMKVDN